MQIIWEWFRDQPDLMAIVQIFLDLLLIGLVFVLLTKRKAAVSIKDGDELTAALEKVIQDTKEIAEKFDHNLQERHRLTQQILQHLDMRIAEGKAAVKELQTAHQAARKCLQEIANHQVGDKQKIRNLIEQGLSPETVAKKLKKPLGEVELIFKLHRLSSGSVSSLW